MSATRAIHAPLLAVVWLGAILLPAPAEAEDGFANYYNFINNWPDEHTPIYAEDVQGLAHSDDSWYVTKSGAHGNVLYRLSDSTDLSNPFVMSSTTPLGSGLTYHGFTKFKAMDEHLNPFDGTWYVIVAVEGGSGGGVAIYDKDLVFKGAAVLSNQSAAGWCAVDPAGKLWSGENNQTQLNRYSVDWQALATNGTVSVSFDTTVPMLSGGSPFSIDHHQGGAFAPEGDKFYLVTGYFDVNEHEHGIHVFEVTSGSFTKVEQSSQGGFFGYTFNPSCGGLDYTCEEPEDLCFWDANDLGSPNVRGEMHVLMLDNDSPDNDDVYIKHYTEYIWVDASYQGFDFRGDPFWPDILVASAVARAKPGMEVRLAPGTYAESITIDKRVKLVNKTAASVATVGGP